MCCYSISLNPIQENPRLFLNFNPFIETVVVAGNSKRCYASKGRGESHSETKNKKTNGTKKRANEQKSRRNAQESFSTTVKKTLYEPSKI